MAGSDGYSFVTYYAENVIGFDFYITPFQSELWYALLATYVSLTLVLSLLILWKKWETSFCPWLYVLGRLLEDGVNIPEAVERHFTFRIVFAC